MRPIPSDWVDAQPAASPLARGAARLDGLWLLLLVGCWIQFTSAWIWPPARAFDPTAVLVPINKPFAVPFQYALWLLVATGAAIAFARDGASLVRRLAIFAPLALCFAAATAFGIQFGASLRLTVLWMVSIISGAVIASSVERDRLVHWIVMVVFVTMSVSLATVFVFPDVGTERYGTVGTAARGVFDHKNSLGRVAALSLVLVVVLGRKTGGALWFATLAVTAACALLSRSMAGLVGAVLAVGYVGVASLLRGRTTIALGGVVFAFVALVGAVVTVTFAPLIADLLGRDMTLTGRTLVWERFFEEMTKTLWLGAGPGSFSNVSPITTKLALEFRALGPIFSPHNFFLATLGDLGVFGALATIGLFAYLIVVLPFRGDTFAQACAGMAMVTALQGMGETLDAGAGGISWFLIALLWVGNRRGGDAPAVFATERGPVSR